MDAHITSASSHWTHLLSMLQEPKQTVIIAKRHYFNKFTTETVVIIEFLGCVPLLQQLPSSSIRKIAQVITFKHYDPQEYVVRDGEVGNGVYFIWDDEAEVSSYFYTDEVNRSEYQLKRYDYFGDGSMQEADVIALTKLTCLLLPHEHCSLLRSKSIWNAEQTCTLVEKILHLDSIEVNIFKGITLPDTPHYGKVFGGQFIGQALAAASKTVDSLKIVHSLHAYFLLVGDLEIPIIYHVHRVRDGNTFATRRIDAIQKRNVVFTMTASFQKEEIGLITSSPDPESLNKSNLTPLVFSSTLMFAAFIDEELQEAHLTNPRLPRMSRNKVATTKVIHWPVEIRLCEYNNSTNYDKRPASLRYWFRSNGKLSSDENLHRCVAAYTSDHITLNVSLNPHRRKGLKTSSASLCHSMWFHRPIRADEWLLFSIWSPTAYNAGGLVIGHMFNRKGELVASITQQGLIRKAGTPPSPSKL